MEEDEHSEPQDICRVCRAEGTPESPLFHPCVCTGSIKFIHQECLVRWLKYSKKEYCELCKHRFSFTPIYSPDMPKRLPIRVIVSGLLKSVLKAIRYWLHYTLVAAAWLGIVPLTACRIYRFLFSGPVTSLFKVPMDMLSTEHLLSDCFQGCFVVTCTLCAFISLVWLREQILHGDGPEWMDLAGRGNAQNNQPNNGAAANDVPPQDGGVVDAAQGQAAAANQNVAVANQDVAGQNNQQNNGDQPWNPIEWDRAAEELTWERLLGLDGSLVFLEHVFWVVSLNTLFILVFAFCPYHIGNFTIVGLRVEHLLRVTQFQGLLTTIIGYIIIAVSLVVLHLVTTLIQFQRSKRIIGLCYIVVKVSLLVVIEIGIFPLICGWWLDICSLSMFDATIKDRVNSFQLAPGTSMFIHWLVGMVFVFYFASFILLLREVLRPGVLWFLRNLNDPDFNPIQEMIHLPVLRHIRRFLVSMVIFGCTILLMLYLPVKLIRTIFPGFLPYNVLLSRYISDAPVSELSLELLLLQVVLPALLEQGHTRTWLKALVRGWCCAASWLLDLKSYLLGDTTEGEESDNQNGGNQNGGDAPAAAPVPPAQGAQPQGLAAMHQAMLQGGGPAGFQPYRKPNRFFLRMVSLMALMAFTLFFASFVCMILPVFLGRCLMALCFGGGNIHELYTAACGMYTCWLLLRGGGILLTWIPQGLGAMWNRLRQWVVMVTRLLTYCNGIMLLQGMKIFLITGIFVGVIPLLLGVLFELVVVTPLRVPLDQSPVFFLWQDWAMGILHTKIVCAITMMGPPWWLRRVMEQVYNQGIRQLDVWFMVNKLFFPVVGVLGMALSLPYIFSKCASPEMVLLVQRRIYPCLLALVLFVSGAIFQVRQFTRLYEHIKNDRYLVGKRLLNYEKPNITRTSSVK